MRKITGILWDLSGNSNETHTRAAYLINTEAVKPVDDKEVAKSPGTSLLVSSTAPSRGPLPYG